MTKSVSTTATRRTVLTGAGGAVASATLPGVADAGASAERTGRPSIVLVHGAFTDGSCWNEVILRLRARGYRARAVPMPLSSLADDVEATRRVLEQEAGPVLLVGHSWGGAVITQAGATSKVAALVYLSALAPDAGEAVADLQRHGPASPAMAAATPDAHGFLWFDPERYHAGLAEDVPEPRAFCMAMTQQPIAASSFGETVQAAAWRQKPSYYLLSEQDRALSPVLQRWMADRMHATVRSVPSSHMSLIAHADAAAALIALAAERVSA